MAESAGRHHVLGHMQVSRKPANRSPRLNIEACILYYCTTMLTDAPNKMGALDMHLVQLNN